MHKAFLAEAGQDPVRGLREALEWIDWRSIIPPDSKVYIKANLTAVEHIPGVTTTPVLIDAVLSILKERSGSLFVCESDKGYQGTTADQAFKGHGLEEIAAKHDAVLLNLSKAPKTRVSETVNGVKVEIDLPVQLLEDDAVVISMPVLKTHSLTEVSAGLKNLYGCVQAHKLPLYHHIIGEVLVTAARRLKPAIVIADALTAQDGNGPFFGTPVETGMLIVADGLEASEPVICEFMGIDLSKVPYLKLAAKEGIVAAEDEIDTNIDPSMARKHSFESTRTFLNQFSYVIFHSYWLSKLIYDSPLTRMVYGAVKIIRGR